MMRATGRAVRASLRAWWPECILLAVCALVTATQGPSDAAAVLVAVGIGWSMGFRHRHRPVWDVIREVHAAFTPDAKPPAEVRHLHSV